MKFDVSALVEQIVIGRLIRSAATYRLSEIVRGRLNTDRFTGTHASGERFCLLESFPGIERAGEGILRRGHHSST